MRYGYICTNYNNSDFTVTAVETLMANVAIPEIIVVVDNASVSEEVAKLQALAARQTRVRLVLNRENVGYFAGLNLGIEAVRESDLDCCIIGNNDLEFPQDFGEKLAQVVRDHAADPVISPHIVTLDGAPQNPHVISDVSRVRELVYDLYYSSFALARLVQAVARLTHRFTDRKDEQSFAEPQHIYQGHGSCYIITRAFFETFGSLWAPTFMMGEEYFLSRQLSGRGFRIFYDPRVAIRHRCNGALDKVPARRAWGMARDAHRVYRRYVNPWRWQKRLSGGPDQE